MVIHFDKAPVLVVDDLIDELLRRSLVGDEFFALLTRVRPRRLREINELRALMR